MPKQPEPYLFLETLGSPVLQDDRSGAEDLLQWLAQRGYSPWNYNKDSEGKSYPTTDISVVMSSYDTLEKPSWRDQDSYVTGNLYFPLPLPEKTWVNFDLDVFKNRTQRAIRVNIVPGTLATKGMRIEDYNPLAVEMRKLAIALHEKMQAKLTVVDWSKKLLAPYPKTMPLYVGWCTIVGQEVARKYHLQDHLSELPDSIKLEEYNDTLIFTSNKSYAEYVRTGWDEEATRFWKQVGGKILLPKGVGKTKPKKEKGETYVVDEDENGNAILKPFRLK